MRLTRPQGALFEVAGNQSETAGFEFLEGALFEVQAETGFAFRGVRPVTGVTMVGEDMPHIMVEIDSVVGCEGRRPGEKDAEAK